MACSSGVWAGRSAAIHTICTGQICGRVGRGRRSAESGAEQHRQHQQRRQWAARPLWRERAKGVLQHQRLRQRPEPQPPGWATLRLRGWPCCLHHYHSEPNFSRFVPTLFKTPPSHPTSSFPASTHPLHPPASTPLARQLSSTRRSALFFHDLKTPPYSFIMADDEQVSFPQSLRPRTPLLRVAVAVTTMVTAGDPAVSHSVVRSALAGDAHHSNAIDGDRLGTRCSQRL